MAAIPSIIQDFQVDSTLAISPITFYTLGLALGPIISAAVSEVYGRRIVYCVSLPLAIAFNVVAGSTSTFRTLAVARFLASVAGSPMVTITIGTLNDLWDIVNDKTGTFLAGLFAASIIWAPELGPLIGASLVKDTENWRWTFWITVIMLGFSCVVLLCPETFGPEILRRREKKLERSVAPRGSFIQVLKVVSGRPLHMLFTEPIIFPTCCITALALDIMFFFYIAFPLVFQKVYSFDDYQVGLSFLPLFVGSLLALAVLGAVDKWTYQAAKSKAESREEKVVPEERLYSVMIGGILLPISLFW